VLEVLDWREQIYYWTGELSYDDVNKRLVWRGSWLGSFVGKPQPEEFAWSNNEFEYVTTEKTEASTVLIGEHLRPPPSTFFHGYYMMDSTGTNVYDKYYDKQFFVEFQEIHESQPSNATNNDEHGVSGGQGTDSSAERGQSISSATCTRYLVLGKGDSEFGPFLLSGTYNVTTKVLDMSRQYIDPNKQSIQEGNGSGQDSARGDAYVHSDGVESAPVHLAIHDPAVAIGVSVAMHHSEGNISNSNLTAHSNMQGDLSMGMPPGSSGMHSSLSMHVQHADGSTNQDTHSVYSNNMQGNVRGIHDQPY
jgi:hypothetical protein